MKLLCAVCFCLLTAAGSTWARESNGANSDTPTVIYLVRHAEKQSEQSAQADDPDLTAAGFERAQQLARVLRDAKLTAIYSTDYKRTQKTAQPLVKLANLPLTSYDPRALQTLADKLKKSTGRVLVVGHSNTTPELVELLGGNAGASIDEASEYDRLYILFLHGDSVTTLIQRYGRQ